MILYIHLTRMQSIVHHRKYLLFFSFDLDFGVMVTLNVVEYPPHHVTDGNEKFEVATSNGYGATLKRKHII